METEEVKLSYYQRNKDKCKAWARSYQAANRDKYISYLKDYYQKNKSELNSKRKTGREKKRKPKVVFYTPTEPKPITPEIVLTPLDEIERFSLVKREGDIVVAFE